MADLGAQSWGPSAESRAGANTSKAGAAQILGASSTASYFMRARDSLGNWVTWFSDAADHAGAGYSAATPAPVGSMAAGSAQVVSAR